LTLDIEDIPVTTHNFQPAPDPTHPDVAGGTSPALVAIAWLVVGVPLAWGVSQTLIRSLDLFRAPPAAAHGQPAPVAPPTALPR
jgi:hypothetical protein